MRASACFSPHFLTSLIGTLLVLRPLRCISTADVLRPVNSHRSQCLLQQTSKREGVDANAAASVDSDAVYLPAGTNVQSLTNGDKLSGASLASAFKYVDRGPGACMLEGGGVASYVVHRGDHNCENLCTGSHECQGYSVTALECLIWVDGPLKGGGHQMGKERCFAKIVDKKTTSTALTASALQRELQIARQAEIASKEEAKNLRDELGKVKATSQRLAGDTEPLRSKIEEQQQRLADLTWMMNQSTAEELALRDDLDAKANKMHNELVAAQADSQRFAKDADALRLKNQEQQQHLEELTKQLRKADEEKAAFMSNMEAARRDKLVQKDKALAAILTRLTSAEARSEDLEDKITRLRAKLETQKSHDVNSAKNAPHNVALLTLDAMSDAVGDGAQLQNELAKAKRERQELQRKNKILKDALKKANMEEDNWRRVALAMEEKFTDRGYET